MGTTNGLRAVYIAQVALKGMKKRSFLHTCYVCVTCVRAAT